MLKKLLIALGVIIVLAVAAILIAPSVVDLNAYKPEIAAQVRKATGRDIVIDGPVAIDPLFVFNPEASVADVRFANAPAGSAPDMASFETLKVRVDLRSLIAGDVKVESIVLVKPAILLETYADGTANWEFTPAEDAADDADEADGDSQISLDRIVIEDGRIEYRDADGETTVVEDIDATLSAPSLTGPFTASGEATAQGVRASFEVTTGALAEAGETPISVALGVPGTDSRVTLSGTLDLGTTPMKLTGHLAATAKDLAAVLESIAPGAGASAPVPLDGPFNFESDLVASPAALEFSNSTLQLGATTATGAATIETGGAAGAPMRVALNLAVNRLDLDALLGDAAAAPDGGSAEEAGGAAPALDLPQGVEVGIDLAVETLAWRNGVISKARLVGKLDNGAFNVTDLSALLPGNTAIDLAGTVSSAEGAPRFAGELSAKSDNVRSLLEWLQVPLPAIPSDRLHKASLTTVVSATPDHVELDGLELGLDNTKANGAISMALPAAGGTPTFSVGLAVDQINIDGYMPPAGAAAASEATEDTAAAGEPLDGLAPLAVMAGNAQLKIGSLTYNAQTIQDVVLDGTLADGTLVLKELSVGQFAGGSGRLSGTVSDLGGTPRFETRIELAASDAARALRFAGVTVPASADLGAMKVGGSVSGGATDVAYDIAFAIAGIGAEGKAAGTATDLTQSVPRIDTTFDLSAKKAGPLLAIAGLGDGGGDLGAMALSGSATSGADQIGYDITLALPDLGGTGALKGTLTGLAGTPVVDTVLDLSAREPAPLLALAGVGGSSANKLGPLKVGGKLAGSAEAMKLDLALEALGGTAKVAGDVGLPPAGSAGDPQLDLAIDATHPELRDLIGAVAPDAKPAQKIGAFTLATHAKSSGSTITLSDLAVAAGPTRIDGTATIDTAGLRPRIDADLKANTIPVAAFAPAAGSASGGSAKGGRWSTEPLDLSLLTGLDGDIALAADSVQLESSRIDNFVAKLHLQDGVLTITQLNGNTQGGTINVTGEVRGRGVPSFSANVAATKLEIADIIGGGSIGARGPLSINGTFSSSGVSMAEMVDALSGRGTIDGSLTVLGETERLIGGGLLGGLGLKVGELRGVTDVVGSVLGMFVGRPSSLDGNFIIERGVLRTDDTTAANDLARALSRGRVNLSAWTLDLVTDVFRGSDNPWLTLALTGRLDAPNVKLAGLAFAPENLGAGVLEQLQGGGSGLIDQIVPGLTGSLPGSGTKVPEAIVPTAPVDAVQDAVGKLLGGQKEEAPKPKPAAEEKPKSKPQDVIKEIVPGLGDLF